MPWLPVGGGAASGAVQCTGAASWRPIGANDRSLPRVTPCNNHELFDDLFYDEMLDKKFVKSSEL